MKNKTKTKEWWEEGETKTNDFYKMIVGDNKIRIVTQFERVDQLFKGVFPDSEYVGMVDESYKPKADEKVATQGWAWGIDRATGEFKIMQLSKAVLKLITQLRSSEDYAFDEFPMPYDITIHNTGVGANRYTITAARKNVELTEEEQERVKTLTPVSEIIAKMKDKAEKTPKKVDYPESNPEDVIPF